jgi:hypothetical protein
MARATSVLEQDSALIVAASAGATSVIRKAIATHRMRRSIAVAFIRSVVTEEVPLLGAQERLQ